MFEFLFAYFNNIRPVSDKIVADVERYLEILEIPKNQVLLREGQRADYLFVVIKGALRMYYIKDGEEICSRFAEEHQMCLSVQSFFERNPSYEYVQALEDSTVARIHFDNLERLYKEHDEFNYIGRVIVQQYFIRSELRLFLIRKQSAEERYLFFTEHYPSLLQRVPLKHIASYLGLTLETLSRIRNKLRNVK